jgi:hypothetical protein
LGIAQSEKQPGASRDVLRFDRNRSRNRRRKVRGSIQRTIAQRLEGSRFGAHIAALAHFLAKVVRPLRVKTSGSRE